MGGGGQHRQNPGGGVGLKFQISKKRMLGGGRFQLQDKENFNIRGVPSNAKFIVKSLKNRGRGVDFYANFLLSLTRVRLNRREFLKEEEESAPKLTSGFEKNVFC